jgi:hypothetical protein
MNQKFDLYKTLEELEDEIWDEPSFQSSLVSKIHQLRKKPIITFTNEDLRLYISQQIGLDYLVPIALERLSYNPFSSGDLFTGDLLSSVLRIDREYFDENPELYLELESLVERTKEIIKEVEEQLIKFSFKE